jgi:ABC-2 type transport system ATP-binding protein
MPDLNALKVLGLQKSYGSLAAVRDLSFEVRAGELYALVGPNGAGKTTTLKMLAGLLRPDAGNIEIGGVLLLDQPEAAKLRCAYVPDEPVLYGRLTPLEYLVFVGRLWKMSPAAANAEARRLLEQLGLHDKRDVYCESLSKGMRQKLGLAAGLIHDPHLLIVDEPLTALDSVAARQVKDLLVERTRQGKAVLLTTHILEVAERLANRIGILRDGRLIAQGTFEELRHSCGSDATLEEIFLSLVTAEAAC